MKKEIKIGVVDDHVQTAVSITQLLEHNGFDTFEAYNPESAIEKAKKEKPDLMIVDVKLGHDEEGYDIARALPNQKVIFMSGYDFDASKIKKFNNYVGYITKPIDIDELLKMIKKEFKL